MKAKLGISVSLMAALAYFFGFFGGYTALLIFLGYVLLREDNEFLRKSAVKALIIAAAFTVLSALIGLIPNLITLIDDLLNIFEEDFTIYPVSRVINFINTVIAIAEKVLFLLLGFKALKQQTIKISFIDKFIDKHFGAAQN